MISDTNPLFRGPKAGKQPDGESQGDPKPQIYVAKWMRKPRDREAEDEEMPTNGKRSEGHEPTLSILSLR